LPDDACASAWRFDTSPHLGLPRATATVNRKLSSRQRLRVRGRSG
jgi:hypothetical protein